MSEIHKWPAVYLSISYLHSLSRHCASSVWKYIYINIYSDLKTTASNYLHSVAGRTQAATSNNKLQMRRHYKAMLMRPVSALWDCHPRSVNVNLSSNVHQRAWRGMEEAERNNNQHLEPSCLHKTFRESHKACSHSTPCSPWHVFSSSFAWSLTPSHPRSTLPNCVNEDGLRVKGLIWLSSTTLTMCLALSFFVTILHSKNVLELSKDDNLITLLIVCSQWTETLTIDHIHMTAIFFWHHAQGKKLKFCSAVFQLPSLINMGDLMDVLSSYCSWFINSCRDYR